MIFAVICKVHRRSTAVKTDKLVVMIAFPSVFGEPSSVYVHPLGLKKEVTKGLQNDRYVFHYVFEQVPANTYVEGRFVFPRLLAQAQITRTVFFLWQTWRKLKDSTQVFTKGLKCLVCSTPYCFL